MLNIDEIQMLCLQGESSRVDFKFEQYKFFKATAEEKDELIKDVCAMANTANQEPSYILIGIEELPNKEGKIVGIAQSDVIDDALLHQFINYKTNKAIPFSSYVVASGIPDRDCLQIIEIAPCGALRPFYLKKNFGRLLANAVYMRDGTSTNVANPEQISAMGEEAALGRARPVIALPEGVTVETDWSACIVEGADFSDLDEDAICQARKGFAEAHTGRVTINEVEGWPLGVLLEKTKLAVDGKLTRAALLLLGKREASVKLSPYVAQITWNLAGERTAYEHFGPPFLLTTTELYRKIRNFQIKILPKNSLLPVSVPKYVEKVVLEPLHNCIAHQDYNRQERIIVTERDDGIVFENAGTFYDGMPNDYVAGIKRPKRYRNRLLAEVMAELHMIDAMGYGIRDVYLSQRERYLPMPDYMISSDHVVVKVYGNVVDESYSRLLIANSDISIGDVVNLDRVQKHLPITPDAISHLRKMGYVESRGKSLRVSSKIAALTDMRAEYIQMRATEDANLKRMILDYLGEYESASRADINKLLFNKIHEALNEEERLVKIGNLLTALRLNGDIVNNGSRKRPEWRLIKR